MCASTKPANAETRCADNEEDCQVPTDEVLVRRIRRGDRPAAELLILRYQSKAFAIACTLCDGDREAALDCTQEAFVKVLGGIGAFKGKSSFYTWFYRILVNTCLDRRRKRIRWERLFPGRGLRFGGKPSDEPAIEELATTDEADDPQAAVFGSVLSQDLEKALTALPEKQRTVFQLKVFHGLTLSEIARMTGAAQGTVKTHLFRATRALRAALREWGEDERIER
ncbi:MAG: RNA polymerase sigma factor [Desulfococcus multivorans]|jgi:RNA polymerase sigma-70 factor (ECF subfamily)|uniref:RNA polymerase sigma factor n=1 Tax=Desulfococcus sp. TaxID=2025834 RepID=UPI002A4188A4|nr:RNA polymerase sigma factor [Desulfococcus multivorans]